MKTRSSSFLAVVFTALASLSCSDNSVTVTAPDAWPVIRSYDRNHLCNIALPLGGIGTGTVSIAGNGELKDWRLNDMPLTGSGSAGSFENAPFFAIYATTGSSDPVVRALTGPACRERDQDGGGDNDLLHGFPGFANASFDAAFPFGQVHLSDNEMPVDVTIKAFNPMVPGEPEVSGLPVAALYFEVRNKTINNVIVSVCGTMRNFTGIDGSEPAIRPGGEAGTAGSVQGNNDYIIYRDIQGIFMSSGSAGQIDSTRGTIALSTAGEDTISWRTGSAASDLAGAIKEVRDDFSGDGDLTEPPVKPEGQLFASLAVKDTIGPGQSRYFRFIITWHFPVRKNPLGQGNNINFYSLDFVNAWDVTKKIIPYMPMLESNTILFVRTLIASDLPQRTLEASLADLADLRSERIYRTADGKLHMPDVGDYSGKRSGVTSAPEKNSYKMIHFLYGKLAETMEETEKSLEPESEMTGWAALAARTGFSYSPVDQSFRIRSSEGVTFWSNGYAWGECVVSGRGRVKELKVKVYGGELGIRKVILKGYGERVVSDRSTVIRTGEESTYSVLREPRR